MTNTPENTNNSDKESSTGYYAVDARRVIQVFELFQMRPSHFSASGKAGAQSVYYDARKIIENRTNNKWGHHTQGAIKNFCHFTQSENGSLLPWQELIEHRGFYDGKEGAGRRTGNLLLTENRVQLRPRAIVTARHNCELSQQQLAEKLALPVRFIEVIENGEWQMVTNNIASSISKVFGVNENTIVTQIPKTTELNEGVVSSHDSKASSSDKKTVSKLWLFVLIFCFVFWAGYQFNSISRESITDHNLVIEKKPDQENSKTFSTLSGCWNWSTGSYIVISENGTALNGPFGASWKSVDASKRRYTMIWPSFVDTVALSENGNVLSGKNNYNFEINANRKSGVQSDLVGTWLWNNGITMAFQSNFTVSGGALKGTWSKAGNNWIIEWPLIDSIILSADGHKLKVKNQFGSVTAIRDVNCK